MPWYASECKFWKQSQMTTRGRLGRREVCVELKEAIRGREVLRGDRSWCLQVGKAVQLPLLRWGGAVCVCVGLGIQLLHWGLTWRWRCFWSWPTVDILSEVWRWRYGRGTQATAQVSFKTLVILSMGLAWKSMVSVQTNRISVSLPSLRCREQSDTAVCTEHDVCRQSSH